MGVANGELASHILETGQESEKNMLLSVEEAAWESPELGSQPCYRLTLDADLFFDAAEPSQSVLFSTFS